MKSLYKDLSFVLLFVLTGIFILTWNAYAFDLRTHVAIIDTGIGVELARAYMCEDGHLDLTGKGLNDVNGHGTNIAGILAKNLNTKTHCLQIIKWFHDTKTMAKERSTSSGISKLMTSSLRQALKYNAKYVNMSLSGDTYSDEERIYLRQLLNSGATIAVAAGNNGIVLDEFCSIYPACYPIYDSKFVVVGNKGNPTSNVAKFLVMENGNNVEGFGITLTGTSQATAVWLSKRIK